MAPFTRGYDDQRERMKKNSTFTRSCFNCEFYGQCEGDTEEVCQNPNVLKYDMVSDGNNIYCLYWKQCNTGSEEKIRKTGRDRFEDLQKEITDSRERRGKRHGS